MLTLIVNFYAVVTLSINMRDLLCHCCTAPCSLQKLVRVPIILMKPPTDTISSLQCSGARAPAPRLSGLG